MTPVKCRLTSSIRTVAGDFDIRQNLPLSYFQMPVLHHSDLEHFRTFESDRGSPNGLYAVFIINRDGSGLIQVTDYALNANHPVFSPDGRRLVFATGDPSKRVTTITVATLPSDP